MQSFHSFRSPSSILTFTKPSATYWVSCQNISHLSLSLQSFYRFPHTLQFTHLHRAITSLLSECSLHQPFIFLCPCISSMGFTLQCTHLHRAIWVNSLYQPPVCPAKTLEPFTGLSFPFGLLFLNSFEIQLKGLFIWIFLLIGSQGLSELEKTSLLLSQSMVQWNSAQFSSSLESLSRGTESFLDSAGQDKNLVEVSKLCTKFVDLLV